MFPNPVAGNMLVGYHLGMGKILRINLRADNDKLLSGLSIAGKGHKISAEKTA
jgi:hypothetical protein